MEAIRVGPQMEAQGSLDGRNASIGRRMESAFRSHMVAEINSIDTPSFSFATFNAFTHDVLSESLKNRHALKAATPGSVSGP